MNYTSLCNALIQKCGISGGSISSVSGQVGEMGRVVAWINEAYEQVQLASQTWDWMRDDVSFVTVDGQTKYTPVQAGVTDMAMWKPGSFRCYQTAGGVGGENFLFDMDYDNFRDTYSFGTMRTATGMPTVISFGPDDAIHLGIGPDSAGYTVVGEYYKTPQALALDADTPLMPTHFHNIIVYRAMILYGMYEAAQEVVMEGTNLYGSMLRRMIRSELPGVTMGSALA